MDRVFKFVPRKVRVRATARYFPPRSELTWQAVSIFLMLWLTSSLFAQAAAVPNDEITQSAEINVTLPAQPPLTNAQPTTVLGKPEVPQTLAIFRFHPGAVTQAEASLRSTFAKKREAFLAALERAARRRVLDDTTVAHPNFRTFVSWFQNEHPAFPLSGHLARLWAMGKSDEAIQSEWASKLRMAMASYIRGDAPLQQIETEQKDVGIISLTRPDAALDVEIATMGLSLVAITNIHTLTKIRKDFLNSFSPEQRDLARFLAGFLKENCFFDEMLTSQLREKKAAEVAGTTWRAPGQRIAENGQTVNVKSNTVDLLRPDAEPDQERISGVFEKLESARAWGESLLGRVEEALSRVKSADWKIQALLGGIALLFLISLWQLNRRTRRDLLPVTRAVGAKPSRTVIPNRARDETISLPAKATRNPAIVPVTTLEPVTPVEAVPIADHKAWQDRVLAAEKRAEELMAMVREGLAPHLARELMNKLVRELISQRAGLLHTHQIAERELSSMEARFEHVISQLQERLAAYEKRNAELEKELAAKREENIELIKARIFMTQNKLEAGQANKDVALN